jgi:hypothetical protein
MIDPREVQELLNLAYSDVKAQLFYAIENIPEQRDTLLQQLDVLVQVKDRINARLGYDNPLAD